MKKKFFADADKGVLCASDYKQTKYKFVYGGLVLYMLIMFAIVLVPVVWMIMFGFKEPVEILSKNPTFFPKEIKLSKMTDIWNQYKIYAYYINTFIMAAGCVLFDVVINGLAGYVLSRLKPKGSKIYFTLVFTLMLLPATVSIVPNYMTFKQVPYLGISLLNTYLPVWLFAGANLFNILLFKSSFDSISTSLVEAAKIDGASNLRIFLKIIVPLSVPVIVTVSLFTFNGQFGNFFWPFLVINNPDMTVIGVRLFQLQKGGISLDVQMMILLFSILPQALIFILFQKRIVGGINIGGVKG